MHVLKPIEQLNYSINGVQFMQQLMTVLALNFADSMSLNRTYFAFKIPAYCSQFLSTAVTWFRNSWILVRRRRWEKIISWRLVLLQYISISIAVKRWIATTSNSEMRNTDDWSWSKSHKSSTLSNPSVSERSLIHTNRFTHEWWLYLYQYRPNVEKYARSY